MDTHLVNTSTIAHPDHKLDLRFNVPAERLFAALSTAEGAQSWWTTHCEVGSKAGELSTFRFPCSRFLHTHVMKIAKLDAPRVLEWESVGSSHKTDAGLTNTDEWVGTRIIFEVSDLGNGVSRLLFTHTKLNERECRDECHQGWSFFLERSLRACLETGKGKPWRDEMPF